MPQQRPRPIVRVPRNAVVLESRQPRRLVLALVLLLATLAAVLIKDRQFWFGTEESSDGDAEVARTTVATPVAANPAPSALTHAPVASTSKKKIAAAPKEPVAPATASPATVATNRTVLPPLDVEVVAGDKHSAVHPGSNAAKVDITKPGSTTAEYATFAAPTNAAERVPMTGSVDTPYPLLAQQMKVQGSVVLQALIGVDGAVQNLRVLSGPAILASAAQQAVRQWRFRPYLQNGQPVETKATITVNFTIRVADNSPKLS